MAAKTNTAQKKRVRKLDYRAKKKVARLSKKLPSSFSLTRSSLSLLWRNKKLFGGILLVYTLLYLLLVKGLATNFQLNETRKLIEEALGDNLGTPELGIALMGALVGTAGKTASESSGVYQVMLFVIMSLAIVWALRQTFEAVKDLKLRTVFYSAMTPLVPYVLVWLVVILQLVPAMIGVGVYGVVTANGIAVNTIEQIAWLLFLLALVGLSIFWVSSSIFATYIAALPGMTPMTALRKARALVKYRRFLIIRKVLFLPLVIGLVTVLIFLPLVLYATVLAEIIFLVFFVAAVLFAHAYFYVLYRGMM